MANVLPTLKEKSRVLSENTAPNGADNQDEMCNEVETYS